nr:probable xyloglucan endotransglucosylase/hydrolase protein 32 [Tanacetum cinerariifolium]
SCNFLFRVVTCRESLRVYGVSRVNHEITYALKSLRVYGTSAKVKTVNNEVRIQALIDGKSVNIKKSSIRRTLRLDDAEGTSCLTNIEIFEGLAKMSAKTTSWNEFSSIMASTIICLATNQEFNFSRYIPLSLVKNIDAGVPFFMFSRFVKLIINHQLGDMAHYKEIFDTPSFTKKVFDNMKREVGILQADTQSTPITTEPSTSKPQKKYKPKKKHTQEYKVPLNISPAEQTLPSPSNDPLPSGEDSLKLKELMDLCANLSNKVLELKSEVIDSKSTYQERIEQLEGMVKRLEEENMVLKELKRRKITNIDADVEINLEKAQADAYNLDLDHQEKVLSMMDVDEEEPADVEEVLEVVKAAKLMTEVVTTVGATKVSVSRKRRRVIIQDPEETTTTATVQPKFQAKDKGKAIPIEESKPSKRQAQIKLDEEVARQLQTELNADINWNDVVEQVKRNERLNDVVMKYQTLKRKPLTQAQARRNMIVYLKNMADEVNEEVKVSETEVRQEKDAEVESSKREDAAHLASKIPIIDYKIHTERNRPYFKIIRADGNHMLMYPLTHFTLEQMLNDVRLQVEEESKMSLELLRLVRRQLNEGSFVTNATYWPPSPGFFPSSKFRSMTFNQGFRNLWGPSHQSIHNNALAIWLDRNSGSGFKSVKPFRSGYFGASIKLQPGYTAGVITAFYSFGFHEKYMPYALITKFNNVLTYKRASPKLPTEIRQFLGLAGFLVDDVPIRRYPRKSDATFPLRPMWVYGSIWDASSWATENGKYKANYRYEPFVGRFTNFKATGCTAYSPPRCPPVSVAPGRTVGLSRRQNMAMKWVQDRYMIYNYCWDDKRDHSKTPECWN